MPVFDHYCSRSFQSHEQFWKEHPALLSAISLLISTSTPLFLPSGIWLLAWAIYLGCCKRLIQYALLIGGVLYGLCFQMPATVPTQEITANFHPHRISPHDLPFTKGSK